MGTSEEYVFESHDGHPTIIYQPSGEHHDRRRWSRPFNRPQSGHNSFGPVNRLFFIDGGRRDCMDEPRSLAPRKIWFEEAPSNYGIRLLRARDGDIRGSQWAGAVFRSPRP